jgi:hypothetical protein
LPKAQNHQDVLAVLIHANVALITIGLFLIHVKM